MQAKRTTSPGSLLSTPDPIRFPLTSSYAADGTRLKPAVVYMRESEYDQGVYSFDTQYAKAREVLLRYGFYVAMVRVDSKSGGKISRAGYQDVELAAKSGLIEAVGVYMMARWGRRASERLRIGEEFDRLGVLVIDAQRGMPDQPGMVRAVMAAYDEQFLRDLAQKAVDNMPRAAWDGKHAAPTPIGYKRVYPEGQDYDKHVTSVMVECEVYGPIVRQVFSRYADGWSTKKIARWLNSLPDVSNPKSKNGRWDRTCVARMLHRRVYLQWEDTDHGTIRWGVTHNGDWLRYQGEVIYAEGRHPWLVDRITWDRVQLRFSGQPRAKGVTERGTTPALLHGYLRCNNCGDAVRARKATPSQGHASGRYACQAREKAQSECREGSIAFGLADAAVLREVARLRGCPWERQAIERAVTCDPHAEKRQYLQRELAKEKTDLQKNVDVFTAVGDVSKPVVDAFKANSQAISERIQALEASLDVLPDGPIVDVETAHTIHEQLQRTQVADLLERNLDTSKLRLLLKGTITAARITERVYSGHRAVWARADVEWTPDVQLLLTVGLLALGPEPTPPYVLSKQEQAAERARRYRARHKEDRPVAQV